MAVIIKPVDVTAVAVIIKPVDVTAVAVNIKPVVVMAVAVIIKPVDVMAVAGLAVEARCTHTPSQANYRCNPHHSQTIIIYLLMSWLWQA